MVADEFAGVGQTPGLQVWKIQVSVPWGEGFLCYDAFVVKVTPSGVLRYRFLSCHGHMCVSYSCRDVCHKVSRLVTSDNVFWTFQNFSPVPVDKSEFGKFHEGDAYLVLRTNEFGGKLSWEVHFWLGKEASQDEVGAAAILAVELDDALGGAPVQYREAQEHESQLFLSHFPSGD